MNILENQFEILIIKKKYSPYDRDDFDYYEIRNIENLFDGVSEQDYCKPKLVKSSFKGNYKYCERRGDKEKNYQQSNILARLHNNYMI